MKHRTVAAVMTPAEKVVSVHADTSYKEIARLLAEHRISAVPVLDVTVADGVVTLNGEVDTRSLAELTGSVVRRTDGVVDVVNNLTYRVDDTAKDRAQGPIRGVFEGRWGNR